MSERSPATARRCVVVLVVALATASACGARSGLDTPETTEERAPADASTLADAVFDAADDAGIDATADAAARDSALPDGPHGPDARAMPRIVFFGTEGTYDEDSLQAFLAAYPASVTRDANNTSPVSVDGLAAYDIVILDDLTRSFTATEATAFATWIYTGGSVISLSGFVIDDATWQQPNSLLADLALQYDSQFIAPATSSCPDYVTDFTAHAVTTGLHMVPFCGGYAVTLSGSCDGPTETVAFNQGAAVAGVCEHGAGRVYLWGDEWVEYSSAWTAGSDTQQFWQDAIDWAAHRT